MSSAVQAFLAIFFLSLVAFTLRFTSRSISIVLRLVAFAIGNWLTKLIVFAVIVFDFKSSRREPRAFRRVREGIEILVWQLNELVKEAFVRMQSRRDRRAAR